MSWGERAGVRRNWTDSERKKLRAEWKEELAVVISDPLRFISVPDTLELRYRYLERAQEGGDREDGWDRADKDSMELLLLDLATKHHDRKVVLLSSADRVIGAVTTTAGAILTNWEEVWTLTEEDLVMMTKDGKHGLCLEENWYSPSGNAGREDRYDMVRWGDFV